MEPIHSSRWSAWEERKRSSVSKSGGRPPGSPRRSTIRLWVDASRSSRAGRVSLYFLSTLFHSDSKCYHWWPHRNLLGLSLSVGQRRFWIHLFGVDSLQEVPLRPVFPGAAPSIAASIICSSLGKSSAPATSLQRDRLLFPASRPILLSWRAASTARLD